jgi:hypothetical protein
MPGWQEDCSKGREGSASRAEGNSGEEKCGEIELGVIESCVSTYFVIGALEIVFCNEQRGKADDSSREFEFCCGFFISRFRVHHPLKHWLPD